MERLVAAISAGDERTVSALMAAEASQLSPSTLLAPLPAGLVTVPRPPSLPLHPAAASSAFHFAAASGAASAPCLHALLCAVPAGAAAADTATGATPLHVAAAGRRRTSSRRGHRWWLEEEGLAVGKVLLQHGGNPWRADGSGRSAAAVAAAADNAPFLAMLAAHDALLTAAATDGTPRGSAAAAWRAVDTPADGTGATLLAIAARAGAMRVVDWCLAHGADGGWEAEGAASAVDAAIGVGHLAVLHRLVEAAAAVAGGVKPDATGGRVRAAAASVATAVRTGSWARVGGRCGVWALLAAAAASARLAPRRLALLRAAAGARRPSGAPLAPLALGTATSLAARLPPGTRSSLRFAIDARAAVEAPGAAAILAAVTAGMAAVTGWTAAVWPVLAAHVLVAATWHVLPGLAAWRAGAGLPDGQLPPLLVRVAAATATCLFTAFATIAVWMYVRVLADAPPPLVPRGGMDDDDSAGAASCVQARAAYRQIMMQGVDSAALPASVCTTCEVARPPRTKHCPRCRVCVPDYDHHCTWTGGDVGASNYAAFVWFVATSTAAAGLWVALLLAYCSVVPTTGGGGRTGLWAHASASPAWLLAGLLPAPAGAIGAALVLQHVRFLVRGLTTNEALHYERYAYLRTRTGAFTNPFNAGGFAANWARVLRTAATPLTDVPGSRWLAAVCTAGIARAPPPVRRAAAAVGGAAARYVLTPLCGLALKRADGGAERTSAARAVATAGTAPRLLPAGKDDDTGGGGDDDDDAGAGAAGGDSDALPPARATGAGHASQARARRTPAPPAAASAAAAAVPRRRARTPNRAAVCPPPAALAAAIRNRAAAVASACVACWDDVSFAYNAPPATSSGGLPS